jgi:hypothetical protein
MVCFYFNALDTLPRCKVLGHHCSYQDLLTSGRSTDVSASPTLGTVSKNAPHSSALDEATAFDLESEFNTSMLGAMHLFDSEEMLNDPFDLTQVQEWLARSSSWYQLIII